MSMTWECTECGWVVERPRAPARCGACEAAGAVFVRADDGADEISAPEIAYETWVRHGMRTTKHWRAHP